MILYYFPIAQNTVNKTVIFFFQRSKMLVYVCAHILLFFYLLVWYQYWKIYIPRIGFGIQSHKINSFCSQIKWWHQGWMSYNSKQGRLWSDCFLSSLIWVCTVCRKPVLHRPIKWKLFHVKSFWNCWSIKTHSWTEGGGGFALTVILNISRNGWCIQKSLPVCDV